MDSNLIINRLKNHYGFKTDKQLCEKLRISSSNLGTWRQRNTLNVDIIFSYCDEIDYNWLFKGDKPSEVLPLGDSSENDSLSCALQTIDKLVTQMAEKDRQIARLIDLVSSEKNSTQVAAVDVSSAVAGE